MENKLMFKFPSDNYSTVNTSIDSRDVIITFEVNFVTICDNTIIIITIIYTFIATIILTFAIF